MKEGRPIRVLHVITRLLHGGAQINTMTTAASLGSPDFESWLATGPPEGGVENLHNQAVAQGIPLLLLPHMVREISPLKDLRTLWRLTWLVHQGRFDVIHTHTSKAGILGRLAAIMALKRPAIVHTPHGHVFYGYFDPVRTRLFIILEKLAGWVTDRLIVLTEQGKRDHERLGIVPSGRIEVIPSGIDTDRFSSASPTDLRARIGVDDNDLLVGSVGRLVPIKGHVTLVEAISRLERLHVVIVGEGSERNVLIARAKDLGCADRVHLIGFTDDVPAILKTLDIFVLPSLNEGMGRALLEAMAAGRCCVGTRVGGVVDLIEDGERGLLVPPGDEAALREALLSLQEDGARRERLARAAQCWVTEAYSDAAMVRRLGMLYEQLVEEKTREWKGGPRWKNSLQDKDYW